MRDMAEYDRQCRLGWRAQAQAYIHQARAEEAFAPNGGDESQARHVGYLFGMAFYFREAADRDRD